MMTQLTARMWDAALSLPSLGDMIDMFLDWIEELSGTMAPPAVDGLICNDVRHNQYTGR
jgi:hypothetical protein